MFEIRMDNKVALVTGVANNLGENICIKLAKAGAKVWIHHNNEREVKDLQNRILSFGGRAHLIISHLQKPEEAKAAIKKIVKQSGRIDILINQQEKVTLEDLNHLTSKKWLETFECNLDVPFLCCQEVLPSMLEIGEGTIINISSEAAETGEIGPHYAATKSALESFSKGLSREFKEKGVKVKFIRPPVALHDRNLPAEVRDKMKEALASEVLLRCSDYLDY